MTDLNIARLRLHNQLLSQSTYKEPGDVVAWMGAVQAQDYGAARWALGLRLLGVGDDAVERAFTDGAILRTHILRPTWHFVTPADIRWLLTLTAPRVHAFNASYYRKLEIGDAVSARSNEVMTKALEGGKQLTRPELISALQQAGIVANDPLRFTLLVMHAELDGVICSGARRGKQFTYALLDERVPQARTLDHDEALAECTRRYFSSHGPATLQDFSWWSGLSKDEAATGLEMVATHLLHEIVGGQTYWFAPSSPSEAPAAPQAYLLPNFDEYTVGYTNRSALIDSSHKHKLDARSGILDNVMVLNGQIIGYWKRTLSKSTVTITLQPFVTLNEAEMLAFEEAGNRYGEFLGKKVNIPTAR